jgi:hypothetical protein
MLDFYFIFIFFTIKGSITDWFTIVRDVVIYIVKKLRELDLKTV